MGAWMVRAGCLKTVMRFDFGDSKFYLLDSRSKFNSEQRALRFQPPAAGSKELIIFLKKTL